VAKSFLDLFGEAIDYFSREYEDLGKAFAGLDSKAQAAAAVAGVMTAALLTVTARDSYRHAVRLFGLSILVPIFGALVLLLLSILASILTMRVRSVPPPYNSEGVAASLEDLAGLSAEELTEEAFQNHYRDIMKAWKKTLEDTRPVIEEKAEWLQRAQFLLLGAAIFVVFVIAIIVLYETS